ncbi:MocC [Alteromonas macleodii]|uniref:myo-inosose-2 dehydratase n=1 Tax=Alteromonas macleodii TaxID=28108 RepID=UPI00057D4323|nr:myo-inosose-2 dehydratase [Alteromonas macleodii]KHT51474.1 MocC [Alteromonas macleodii]
MTVEIGINPLTWSNDDLPSLGADIPLEVCLREGKSAGFKGFELGNKFPREPKILAETLNQFDLKLVSGWFSGDLFKRSVEEEIIALSSHLELLKELGAKVMVYCDVHRCIHGDQQIGLRERPVLSKQDWLCWGQKLSRVADYCESHGVQLAYHHHMGTLVQSEDEIDLLMSHTNQSLGLLLDTGHISYAGGDPLSVFEKHKSRVNHIHCKDIRAEVLKDNLNRNSSFLNSVLDGVFTVPGDGDIDFLSLFHRLKEHNYKGWLVVEAEQDPEIHTPSKYAKLGFENVKALCEKASLDINL